MRELDAGTEVLFLKGNNVTNTTMAFNLYKPCGGQSLDQVARDFYPAHENCIGASMAFIDRRA